MFSAITVALRLTSGGAENEVCFFPASATEKERGWI
jgi:hypothetical protein